MHFLPQRKGRSSWVGKRETSGQKQTVEGEQGMETAHWVSYHLGGVCFESWGWGGSWNCREGWLRTGEGTV